MAKFKVTINVIASCPYTVEVDAADELKAEDAAAALWRDKLPSDFQVEKGYITDWEAEKTEQLTFDCERCEKEFPLLDWSKHPDAIQPWKEDQDYCAPCGAEILKKEVAADRQRNIDNFVKSAKAGTV
jgi:hypothetical protein